MLCYCLSEKNGGGQRWVGAVEVIGPSNDSTEIHKKDYPVRFDVRPLILLDLECGVPISVLEGKVDFYRSPQDKGTYKAFFRRSLNLFKQPSDGKLIYGFLEEASNIPAARTVAQKKLAMKPYLIDEVMNGENSVPLLVSVPNSDVVPNTGDDESKLQDNVMAFWHCFGIHAGELPEDILKRKQREIGLTGGWTLWSFQRRTWQAIESWRSQIRSRMPTSVLVLCSRSPNAIDPQGAPIRAEGFKHRECEDWKPIPDTINIPHPFGDKTCASAFCVSRILSPSEVDIPSNFRWLRMTGNWSDEPIPTRGEYLLKPGEGVPLRPIHAILKLQEPYVVEITKSM